jgi:cytochrome c oxidase assembly protein subunit 11
VAQAAAARQQGIRRTALFAIGLALAMLGLGYASSPLYRLFCEATGYAGTTRRASEAQAASAGVANGEVLMRFDANVERGMPWEFQPERSSDTITLGGRHMAFFTAENTSDKPVTGRATFNVTPEQAGRFFNKIQCFCFNAQTLHAHQKVRMPVVYYVDPRIKDDPDANLIDEITLSYTFHKIAQP